MFNFQIKNTQGYIAVKRARLFLFSFARIFRDIFLVLLVVAFFLTVSSFLNLTSGYYSARLFALFLSLFLLFWNINLFVELKVKKPKIVPNILDVSLNLASYNLAEFLDFNAVRIVLDAESFCERKKIPINSTALFYSALRLSKDISLICMRLGINPNKLQTDIKNYLEKVQKAPNVFTDDFKQTMVCALNVSAERGRASIGEKEIFVALVKEDSFLKQILVDFDLKPKDVEDLTLWLDSANALMERNKKFWTYENLLREGSLGKDWSSGYTVMLDRFSIDWRRVVSKWRYREIIGHKKEIEQTETILSKSNLANVLLVGNPGTGRKSIIEALAQKCYLGNSLPQLNNKRVVELDPVLLAAQIPDFEKLEYVLDQIFLEVTLASNIILVIDDLENFVGQKMQKAGAFDLSGVLSKYLPLPNFQFIGITSYEGLHKNIEENVSFASFFEKVEVGEVTEKETINILQTHALELEYKNKILILYPSIREAVNLTARYIPSLPFPKKALDVLDESAVYAQRLKEKVVLPHHIAEIVSKKTEIPVGKMDLKEKETLLNLENLIHKRIVNQQEAVNEISIAMRRARSGLASKTRPMGTFLFLGPTGVGKTETAKALAQIYFGRPAFGEAVDKMIRIDMSEFQRISDIPRLIGAVSPVEMQGMLTTPVIENPFSLILLDEIEKAHKNILNLFLQVFDEGYITDGQGRKVVFTNTIIICTSNAAAESIFKEVESGVPIEKQKLLQELFEKRIFKPELINRFDAVVIFHPLTKENLLDIAQLMLGSLKKNLEEKEIEFEITDHLKEKIVELSYKPEFGAREMRRVIQDKVENSVAQALIGDKIQKSDRIEIDPETFEIIINPTN
jgi:ATP-dependent Clp protease ATP-binding subunit ClpC